MSQNAWYNDSAIPSATVRVLPAPARLPVRLKGDSRRTMDMDLKHLQDLFIGYVRGDETAFAEFYVRVYPILRSWLGRRIPPEDVDDLIQDFFLRLHAHRHLVDTNRPILPYMRTILEHLLVDFFRRHSGAPPVDLEIDALGAALDAGTERYEWDELLRQLPEADRRLIIEHFYRRDSIQEIALRQNVSPGALRVRKYRLIRKLRKLLGGGA